MKLHTIARFGGALSVILFLIGVGMYCFARLTEAGDGRNMNLLTLVPDDCMGVLETDNLEYFSNEFPHTSYALQLDTLRASGIIHTILADMTSSSAVGSHRLGNQMSHLVISFHSAKDIHDVVVYFRMTKDAKKMLTEMVPGGKLSSYYKKETYRGESIRIYPCGNTRFLTVYSGNGFLAVSYQKRLIERVIDARKDGSSLRNDENFCAFNHNKTANFMTFYSKSTILPVLAKKDDRCWSEFNIHINSDVFYLSGALVGQDECMRALDERLEDMDLIADDRFLVASGVNKVDSCISEAIIAPHNALFDECVANLSRDASFIMVADLDKVEADSERFKAYIPTFVMDNLDLFRSFILSVQITKLENRLSHIFVFTYKD